ncbi:MAG: amidohydrolase [Gemmatimonadales bacterium]|nr:amidohydrolase [Gemmatimonadales bacterium]
MRRVSLVLVLATGMSPQLLPAQYPAVDRAITAATPAITAIRHQIHQNPELSNRETETAALVAAHLRELGLEVRTGVAHTGVVGVLRGGRPGPVVAVRADMDALPVTEDTPFPFKSTKRVQWQGAEVGVSHACGHDIHTSAQLGLATVLAGMRAELPGTVVFIFQPAEEGPPPGEEGGAKLMLAEGAFADPRPEAVFGFHTKASLQVGKVHYTVGPAFSAADIFRATISGRQSHGAAPHLSVDPIVTASQAVLALQTIRSRNTPPLEPSVLTVGVFRAGQRFNIIPATAELEGTVRTFSPTVQDTYERRIREILAGVTASAGATFTLEYQRLYPLTVNDTTLSGRAVPSLVKALGAGNVTAAEPWMASEDFSYFANTVPGFYFSLGMTRPGTVSGDHHTPTFLADDSAIPVGMKAMAYLVLDYLNRR